MASQLLKKICSMFNWQPPKNEDARSFRTINAVFGDWTTSAIEALPPYTDSPESKSYLQIENYDPPPPFSDPRLQICPHETLSFEGLRKNANSLAIKSTGEAIDALTLSCHEHRSQIGPIVKKPKHVCTSSPGLLRGSGTYSLECSKDFANTPDIVLSVHWDLGFLSGVRGQVETAAELQEFLGADGIWLCPHKRINDSDVVNAIYGFVKRFSGREVITECDRCDTETKIHARMEGDEETCRVTTKRYLGTLERPDDPLWLAQCGV